MGEKQRHHHHDAPPAGSAAADPQAVGDAPDVVMIIRHGEKPTGSGGPAGVTVDGRNDDESLTVQGWTRAGALIGLFDPRAGDGSALPLRAGLSKPAAIYASDPNGHGSARPQETVLALSAALGLTVNLSFDKGQEAQLVAGLAGVAGPVLIAWQHENIDAIIAALGPVDPAPPRSWPGSRFDMVYVFTRNGDSLAFAQIPQVLLAGDSATPFT